MDEINKTFIVLIPKVYDPKSMGGFRPISLCNVLYKIISKVMANKLKLYISWFDYFSKPKCFVPKWLITDNVLVAFEIFHAMKRGVKGKDS